MRFSITLFANRPEYSPHKVYFLPKTLQICKNGATTNAAPSDILFGNAFEEVCFGNVTLGIDSERLDFKLSEI